MSKYYILTDSKETVACDVVSWSKWNKEHEKERQVRREQVGDASVSTVFLGLDHNYSGRGEPILWETMVFGGALDQEQDRCSGTWADAEAMHDRMKLRVEAAQNSDEQIHV